MSKTGGVIEKVGEQHTISLNFSTKRLDTYTTYIIVENVSNPHNLKMVRVNFKVTLKMLRKFSKKNSKHYIKKFIENLFMLVNL